MELVMEEYGQAFLAMLVMLCGITMAFQIIVNEGVINEIILMYMNSICK